MLLEFFQFSSDGKSAVIWEFQSLGGPYSEFSKVPTLKTAMSHRNARHCLMLKSWGPTIETGDYWFGVMSNFSYSLAQLLPTPAAYVNHMDYELWDYQAAYYGVTGVAGVAWNYTVEKLVNTNTKYDQENVLRGFQLF